MEKIKNYLGIGSFLIGISLCIIATFIDKPILYTLIIVFGIIVGLLNITEEEVVKLLVAIVAILVGSNFIQSYVTDEIIPVFILNPFMSFLKALMMFFSPSVIIIGIKTLIDIARD